MFHYSHHGLNKYQDTDSTTYVFKLNIIYLIYTILVVIMVRFTDVAEDKFEMHDLMTLKFAGTTYGF